MQVNSISSYSFTGKNRANKPVVNKSADNNLSSGQNSDHKMANQTMAVLVPLTMLPAIAGIYSCDKGDAEAYTYGYKKTSGYASAITGSSDSINQTGCDRCRDTIRIIKTNRDTMYIDTGSYIHDIDTIIKWRDRWVRPIPLDSLMKNLKIWNIPGTDSVDITDSTTNRNVVHYEVTHEWEYNDKEIGNMNMLESSRKRLVYDTEMLDYKDNHLSYGKMVFRIPSSEVPLKNAQGFKLSDPKGFFVEIYDSKNKKDVIDDSKLKERYFCQTVGDSLKIFKQDEDGVFIEATGRAAKGYFEPGSILLKDLIGDYETETHFRNVKIEAVNDEELRAMYLRKKDEAEAL